MHERPLSPHLQIYKPQLTSVLSIIHRLTGVYLSLGMFVLVCWLYALAENPSLFDVLHQIFQHVSGRLILFSWVFSFYYHMANGVRHLMWDMGKGMEMCQVYISGYIMVLSAVILTSLTYWFTW